MSKDLSSMGKSDYIGEHTNAIKHAMDKLFEKKKKSYP